MFENEERIEIVDQGTMEEAVLVEEELSTEELEEVSGGARFRGNYTEVKCKSFFANIHEKCSSKSNVIGSMKHLEKLPYLGTYTCKSDHSVWYKVRTKNGVGYVSRLVTSRI